MNTMENRPKRFIPALCGGVALLVLTAAGVGEAYEVGTHMLLTRLAVRDAAPEIETELRQDLGLPNGLDEELSLFGIRRKASAWIEQGSIAEDNLPRPYNHFHNPLRSAADAGLSIPGLGRGDSAIVWSQRPAGTQSSVVGSLANMSWHDAREHHLEALRAAGESERRQHLLLMLKALGHLSHLVQDATAPSHVRDDVHPPGDSDEFHEWVELNLARVNQQLDESRIAALGVIETDAGLLRRPHGDPSMPDLQPVANLIDGNVYTWANLDPEATLGAGAGLAELTSANFFSEDTITVDGRSPKTPHPELSDMPVHATDPSYRSLLRQGNVFVPHLVRQSVLQLFGQQIPVSFTLDDAVYQDYAARLLPRAVGSSAALLRHFFRGGVVAGRDSGGGLELENRSPEELDGVFTLLYDDTAGVRRAVPGARWTLRLGAAGGSLPSVAATPSFAPPGNAAVPGRYLLVFAGRLGLEEGAVFGQRVEVGGFNLLAMSPTGVVSTRRPTISAQLVGPGGPGYLYSVISIDGASVTWLCCGTNGGTFSYTPPAPLSLGVHTASLRSYHNNDVVRVDFEQSWQFVVDVPLVCTGGMTYDSFSGFTQSGFGHYRWYDWQCNLGGEVTAVRITWEQDYCNPARCSSWAPEATHVSRFFVPYGYYLPTEWSPPPQGDVMGTGASWSSFLDVTATLEIQGKTFTVTLPSAH
jgi:hypothetical protein